MSSEEKPKGGLLAVVERSRALLERPEGGGLAKSLSRLLAGSFGAAFELAFGAAFVDVSQKRIRVFLDELGYGATPPPSLLGDEDFVHAFFGALKAAGSTRRPAHIRLYARLVASAFEGERFRWTDTDDDLLSTLAGLTHRELVLLAALDRHGTGALDRAAAALGTDADEVQTMLARLERTGCWRPGTGFTSRFRTLRDRVRLDLDEMTAGEATRPLLR
jgi:hypothetical protein